MQDNLPTLSNLLTKADICKALSLSERGLELMVKSKAFPPGARIGKYLYWSEKALQNWRKQQFAAQEKWFAEVA